MTDHEMHRVGYVVKRYPRFSETFIVNEILAHEAAGVTLDIFSVLPPEDTHFQSAISKVRAPVTYLPQAPPSAAEMWEAVQDVFTRDNEAWKAMSESPVQQ